MMSIQYSRFGLNYERKGKKKETIKKGKKKIDWVNIVLGVALIMIIIFYLLLR